MFQTKSFADISQSMIEAMRNAQKKVTDFSVGSVSRTILEAPAAEIEALYLRMALGLQDAIPAAIYGAFDFDVRDPMPSSGTVTITFDSPTVTQIVIPAGTDMLASASGLYFRIIDRVVVPIGSTSIAVTVVCRTVGTVGNVAPNAISTFRVFNLLPTYSVTHAAFTSGQDIESEDSRRSRFAAYLLSISRGTLAAVRYGAMTAKVLDEDGNVQEYVSRIGLEEFPGLVKVYLRGSAGDPSRELLSEAKRIVDGFIDPVTGLAIDGYRPAGVEVRFLPVLVVPVNVAISVMLEPSTVATTALAMQIKDVIRATISDVLPGGTITTAMVVTNVLGVRGTVSCWLHNWSNVTCGLSSELSVGTITLAWADNA